MFRSKSVRRTSSRRRHTGQTFRPRLEALEERMAPSAGDLDLSFGPNGTGKATYGPDVVGELGDIVDHDATAIAIQSDGKIVTALTTQTSNGSRQFGVARFNADGTPDSSFGNGGFRLPVSGEATDVAIQGDGKIVVAGFTEVGDFIVTRLKSNGGLDSSFDSTTIDFGGHDEAYGVAIQDDGRIVVAGTSFDTSGNKFAVARLLSNGALDSDFDVDGKVTTSFPGSDHANGRDVVIQNDGRIVVAGAAGGNFALARYNSDGSRDTNFGFGGFTVTAFPASSVAASLAIQADNKIVLAGTAFEAAVGAEDFALARYNSNGSLDTSFGDSGRVQTDVAPGLAVSVDIGESIVILPNGKIVVGGWTLYGGSGANFALARYDSSGQLDTTFSSDGLVATDFNGEDDQAFGIAIQSTVLGHKIIVVGSAGDDLALARYHGQTDVHIGGYSGFIEQGVLSLQGTPGNDAIVVTYKGGGEVELSSPGSIPDPGAQRTESLSNVTHIIIEGLDGDDQILIQQRPFDRVGQDDVPLVVEFIGGAGIDTVSFQGRPGADSVAVAGDRSRPREPGVQFSFEYLPTGLTTHLLSTGIEAISLDLGDGENVCNVQWDPVQFGEVNSLLIDAGADDDDISVIAELLGRRSDNYSHNSIQVRAGAGDDKVHVNSKATESWPLTILLDGEAGNDQLSLLASVDSVQSVEVIANGGAGDDVVHGHVIATGVARLDVILSGEAGNDQVSLFTSVGLLPAVTPEPVRVTTVLDGGSGDDMLSQYTTLDFGGAAVPPNPPEVPPYEISNQLLGGDGIDEISVEYRDAYIPQGSNVNVNVNLGSGARKAADLLFENVPVDGLLMVGVNGSNGDDNVAFEYLPGSGVARVGPTGAIISNIFLAQGDNTAHYEYIDALIDGQAVMNTYAGAGNDEVTSSAIGATVRGSMVNNTFLGSGYNIGHVEYIDSTIASYVAINMFGGALRDELTAMFAGGEIAAGATVSVRMFGFGGPNLLRTDLIDVVHAGNLRLQMTGGRQRDVITAALDLDPASTGAVFAQLRAGAGNDLVRFDLLGSRMTRILPGSLADGGRGYDRFRGNAKLRRINFEY